MANRTCPHCRKKIHHRATACPYCTKEVEQLSFWKTGRGVLVIIGLIIVGFAFIGSLFG